MNWPWYSVCYLIGLELFIKELVILKNQLKVWLLEIEVLFLPPLRQAGNDSKIYPNANNIKKIILLIPAPDAVTITGLTTLITKPVWIHVVDFNTIQYVWFKTYHD